MTLKELETHLLALTAAEKAQAVKLLALDLAHAWPGIEKTPGVAGNAACVVRTRIPVWVLEGYRRLGWSEARILDNYPALRAADLVNAWAYADAHPDEVERRQTTHFRSSHHGAGYCHLARANEPRSR